MASRTPRNARHGLFATAAGLCVAAALALALGATGAWIGLGAALVLVVIGILRSPGDGSQGSTDGRVPSALDLVPPFARDVLEALPDPLMLIEANGRVLFANGAMRGVAGTDADRKHVSSVLRTPSVLQAIARTAETGEPCCVEFAFYVPVERHYQAHVIRTEQQPQLTALLLHDLTSLKRAEQARADFIANASHELRTPLAAVSGFIDTLRGHARDDAAARDRFLDIMNIEAQRMRRLIDDLLSLTRIELNEHVPPAGEVDLISVAREAAVTLGPLAEADGISIAIDAPQTSVPVIGERDELIQVFQNLIHNAIKYGKPGGHVCVTLAEAGDAPFGAGRRGAGAVVQAVIRDDGEGIPREAIPRLTERFYRVDVKRSRERGGTGLGLAIVKHIVNRHKGRLLIDSRLGEGSTITILLPAATAEGPSPVAVTEVI